MKSFEDFGIDLRGKTGIEVKTVCPKCSHTRRKKNYPCLNVNTEKNIWHCWHCEWSGTLAQGEDRRSDPYAWRAKTYRKPEYHDQFVLDSKPLVWLKDRGLTEEVIERAKIGWGKVYMPQVEAEVYAIQFPYYRAGECVNIKYRDLEKNFRMAAGAERILYGLDDIVNTETAIITEGELDKLSLAVAGHWNCLSVPDGAPALNTKNYSSKFEFLDSAEKQLEPIKKFILAVDGDTPGKKLEEELARRLGRERCYRVKWPDGCKDANEVLQKYGAAKLKQIVCEAKPYPIKGIFEIMDLSARVQHIYEHGMPKAEPTGWKALDGLYSVRPGEWTLATGIPSHGKSEFIDSLMVNLARRGWSFGIFSPENQPLELHISKLAEKVAGKPFSHGCHPRMSTDELQEATAWLHNHVYFVLPEQATVTAILDLAKALVFRHGIRGLIIDPWNELDHLRPPNLTETEYISASLSRIRAFARQRGVHVFVVAHPTKLPKDKSTGSYGVPTPYDVQGSAHWRNKADNCLCVWRDLNDPDSRVVQIHVQKIRFKDVGQIGMAELVYHRPTGRYFDVGNGPREIAYASQS